MTKPEASQFIAQSIPQAQLVVLQPCGHMGPLERNAEMIEAVDRFSKAVFTLEVAAW